MIFASVPRLNRQSVDGMGAARGGAGPFDSFSSLSIKYSSPTTCGGERGPGPGKRIRVRGGGKDDRMFTLFESGFDTSRPVVDPAMVVHQHGWAAADSGLRTRKHFEPTCDRPAVPHPAGTRLWDKYMLSGRLAGMQCELFRKAYGRDLSGCETFEACRPGTERLTGM